MKTRIVALKEHSYPITLSLGTTLTKTALTLRQSTQQKTLFVVTQKKIKALYGAALQNACTGLTLHWCIIPDGEEHKNLKTCESLIAQLVKAGAHRRSTLVAFGGGVVGDITGFVASIFMRGIAYVQIPTTLLAQVDASVGGKTGVDLPFGKNLVGSFKQPKAVCVHPHFLQSLSEREFKNGLAEVVKAALISTPKFCAFLLNNAQRILQRHPNTLTEMIWQSILVKVNIVEKDVHEKNVRAHLNYGHTLAHAIEAIGGFKTHKHGEAVAMGLAFAVHLADRLDFCQTSTQATVHKLLQQFDLPTAWPRFSKTQYRQFLSADKKSQGATIQFILPVKLGTVKKVPLKIEDILRWL